MDTFNPTGDPVYLVFEAGVKSYLDQTDLPHMVRWHPRDGHWYSYPPATNTLRDVGLPASEKVPTFGFPPMLAQLAFSVNLPEIFQSTEAYYKSIQNQYPEAVWNPLTGEWLVSVPSDQVPLPHPPVETELQRQIQQVRNWVADGTLTPEEGEARIQAILATAPPV